MGKPRGNLRSIKSLKVSKCLLEGARISMMGRSCSTKSGNEVDIHTAALNSLLVEVSITSRPTNSGSNTSSPESLPNPSVDVRDDRLKDEEFDLLTKSKGRKHKIFRSQSFTK